MSVLDNIDWGLNEEGFINMLKKEILEDKIYEKYFEVQEGDVVMDVGGNVGAFTVSVLHKNPKHIYCIEPSNTLVKCIEKNVSNTKIPVTIINKAISNEKKQLAEIPDSNVYIYYNDGKQYSKTTFKDVISEYNIDKIDFLKFDCEGGEYEIFTKENYEFISNNVKHMVGEWHINDHENAVERFIEFRDLYLKNHKNFTVLERDGKDVTFEIFDNDFLYRFRDWYKETQLGQFFIYINNSKPEETFLTSDDHDPRIWVVDNFYKNPMLVRKFALKQGYIEGGFGKGFIGKRTHVQFLFPGLKERFEQIMNRKIVRWQEHGMNGRFQLSYAGEPLVYHCDEQKWAGMLFLTPDAPFEAGTTMYAHKKTKIRNKSHPDIYTIFTGETTLDKTPYEEVDVVGNVFNRLVIFDAGNIHSASQYFGFNNDNCRLWQMFFFD
jgi:FkbM family methyltransferase